MIPQAARVRCLARSLPVWTGARLGSGGAVPSWATAWGALKIASPGRKTMSAQFPALRDVDAAGSELQQFVKKARLSQESRAFFMTFRSASLSGLVTRWGRARRLEEPGAFEADGCCLFQSQELVQELQPFWLQFCGGLRSFFAAAFTGAALAAVAVFLGAAALAGAGLGSGCSLLGAAALAVVLQERPWQRLQPSRVQQPWRRSLQERPWSGCSLLGRSSLGRWSSQERPWQWLQPSWVQQPWRWSLQERP